jgi:hypothetical protein
MFKQLGTLLFQLLQQQTKVDFDLKRKLFRLTTQISDKRPPSSVIHYVERRKNISFKPHQTTFFLTDENQVHLTQEIPFHTNGSLREQLVQFWKLAQHCHHMLLEMTLEQTLEEMKSGC